MMLVVLGMETCTWYCPVSYHSNHQMLMRASVSVFCEMVTIIARGRVKKEREGERERRERHTERGEREGRERDGEKVEEWNVRKGIGGEQKGEEV